MMENLYRRLLKLYIHVYELNLGYTYISLKHSEVAAGLVN